VKRARIAASCVTLMAAAYAQPLAAQAPVKLPDPINFYVGYPPGGSFDVSARLVTRFVGKYLPGKPNIVVKYMPGGGTRVLSGYLFSAAKRDGSEFGQLHSGVLFKELFTGEREQMIPTQFLYVGSLTSERQSCMVWHTVPVQTLEDARKRDLAMGVADPVGTTAIGMRVLNKLVGTRLKPIAGYPGGSEQNLAIERGELDGRCWNWGTAKSTKADWIADKKVRYFVQMSLTQNPELPDVPLIMDLLTNDQDRAAVAVIFDDQEIGFPFALPPGVSPEIVAAFRAAFDATTKDPEFLHDAKLANVDIDPVTGQRVQTLIENAYASPAAVVERARDLMWK
jgi:tripartite-type tricarboxylate transporter receptor subunit TctC